MDGPFEQFLRDIESLMASSLLFYEGFEEIGRDLSEIEVYLPCVLSDYVYYYF